MKKDEGARYAIEVDGAVRTHRDDVSIALEAAAYLREKQGNKIVRVVDTYTGLTVPEPSKSRPAAATPLFGPDSKPRR